MTSAGEALEVTTGAGEQPIAEVAELTGLSKDTRAIAAVVAPATVMKDDGAHAGSNLGRRIRLRRRAEGRTCLVADNRRADRRRQ